MKRSGSTTDRAAVRAEAAAWIARLQSEERGPADEAAFQAWLAEHPSHAEAFDSMTSVWDLAGGAAPGYQPPPRAAVPARAAGTTRRMAMAGAATLVAATVAVVVWTSFDPGKAYATAPGETRRVALADGSTVTLDSNTSIRVRLGRARRAAQVTQGRAHFEVAKDAQRPFVVSAGGRTVTALGTMFDVSRAPTFVSVVLIEGRVGVRSTNPLDEEVRFMTPGERLVFAADGAVTQDRPNLVKLTAWESGDAVFENDTIAAAAAELNRYSHRPIVVQGTTVSRMRVSGVFRAGATEEFALSVQTLLPVKVRFEPDRIVIEARALKG
jgi:transmembrane sensor